MYKARLENSSFGTPHISAQAVVTTCAIVEEIFGSATVEKAFRIQGLPAQLRYDTKSYIPNTVLVKLLETFARLTGLDSFGVLLGEHFPVAELGVYGQYVTNAPTLEHAIQRASRALCFRASGAKMLTQNVGQDTMLIYAPATPNAVGVEHHSSGVVCLLIDIVRHFAGEEWCPEYIDLNYREASHQRQLEDHFNAKIRFGAQGVAISIPNNLMSKASPKAKSTSNLMTIHDVRRMVSNRPPRDFAGMVKLTLDFKLREGISDIENVSEWVGLGTRTLQRRLRVEGWNYSELLQASLLEWANELLIESDATITEIARALGYSSKHHFIRAYKKWTGVPPGRARKENRSGILK